MTADWLLDDEVGFDDEAPEEEPTPDEAVEAAAGHPYAAQGWVGGSGAPAAGQAYPEWIDHLPGFMGRMLKKYGWLFGVRIAISGALFILMGMVMLAVSSSMSSSFNDVAGSMFPATSNAGITFFDEAGNMVDASYFGLTNSDLNALGLGGSSGFGTFGGLTMTSSMTEPFDIFCGFIIFLGVVQLVGGLALAWYLKKKGQEAL